MTNILKKSKMLHCFIPEARSINNGYHLACLLARLPHCVNGSFQPGMGRSERLREKTAWVPAKPGI